MSYKKYVNSDDSTIPMRPATTPKAREEQLVSLAVGLAEKQLREGTASSQVITHFLKLATAQSELEAEKIKAEVALANAKVEAIKASQRSEEKYDNAIRAMKLYSGNETDDNKPEEVLNDGQN